MNTKKLNTILASLILIIQATTVNAALINRGGGLIYDDDLGKGDGGIKGKGDGGIKY